MSDPSGIKPVPPSGAASGAGKGQVVQIVSLPEGLQNNARAIRLEGEVVQQNKDGSVKISTPQGDIDINIRGRQPQPGQKIEVDIPPGNPPRSANIRTAPAQPAPQPQQPPTTGTPPPQTPLPPSTQPVPTTPPAQGQPAPPPTSGTGQPSTQPVQNSGQTPVTTAPPVAEKPAAPLPDTYQPNAQAAAKPAPVQQLPPLNPGQIVKLVPVPQGNVLPEIHASPLSPDSPDLTVIPKIAAQAAIVPQKSESSLITTLLKAVKSALPQTGANIPGTIVKPAVPTATNNAIIPQNIKPMPAGIIQQPLTLPAKILSLTLPSGQTLSLPQISAPVNASPVAAPITTAPAMATQPAAIINTAPPFTVTIAEVTPQNQPIVPIPINDKGMVQNFILQSPPASVPVGTQITLQPQPIPLSTTEPILSQTGTVASPLTAAQAAPVMQVAPPVSMLPPQWRTLLPLMQPSSAWPAMDDIFQTFYQATPQAAQIMGRTIPSPANGANFGPAVMLFAAALKSGDLQSWLGDKKLEMIQKLGKESLLSRLSGETSSLTGNNDAPATEWKSFPIPLLWQNEISKVLFHVRKEPSENEQEQGEGGTRFVMDLSLTRMGEVQLDGLVRGKRLDLIVRTGLPISAPMQEAMSAAYAKALDGTDIYGEIGFQSDRTNWENILKREDRLGASA